MTYEEFVEYSKQKIHDELAVDYDSIEFLPAGFTLDDPEKEVLIKYINDKYFNQKSKSLISDIMIFPVSESNDRLYNGLAIRRLYEDSLKKGTYTVLDDTINGFKNAQPVLVHSGAFENRSNGDYEKIREQLILRPLNYRLHMSELKGCVYKKIGDFVLALYQFVGKSGKVLTSSKIKKDELKKWGKEDKVEEVMQDALKNTARLFPACVYSKSRKENIDFLQEDCSKNDISAMDNAILLSTFEVTNGAIALFYPGVAEKMSSIMGGAFTAVFMNTNDVMIFRLNDPAAKRFAKVASESSELGEMLSGRCYKCDKNKLDLM